ncbi:MAG: cadmium-translocating P-type ATPase [Clostridia bacterium]|nr:cadmium-translocating P-type ATPase [Clostridia bacterium]
MNKKQKITLLRILAAAALLLVFHFLRPGQPLAFFLYLIPYLIVGYDVLNKAFKGIIHGQVMDESFLMAVATIGAFALALTKTGDYVEAVAVMLFYQTGELFQSIAVGRSRRDIASLMDIRPDEAFIEKDGAFVSVDPDEVEIGTVISVRPGEKIPIDGIITDGRSAVDTAALTGESVPRDVHAGDNVLSGSINLSGLLHIQTTREFGESTASKILDLVENASSSKAPSENFIAKFARVYTPAVCISALILAFFPPLFSLLMGRPALFGQWIYRALTFLVISCPCALVISIPLTFFAGLGGASRAGVLIKGSNYVETLSKVRTVVLDKTGTLTHGVFEVSEILNAQCPHEDLLEITALAESASTHPISRSIQQANRRQTDLSRVSDIQEISGHGVIATVDGKPVAAGNDRLMDRLGIETPDCPKTGTIVHTAIENRYAGSILISDRMKETSTQAISDLKEAGVTRVIMLTGDTRQAAESVATQLSISDFRSELLPQDKVHCVEQFLAEKPAGTTLAFVGDGINDAPVLSRADVGIAMGGLGSDAAIEAADVVIMDDNPRKIAKAVRIARKCMRIVYENIFFAIGVKLCCLLLSAIGLGNMWLAVFADVGVMVLAVLNAIRALMVRNA